MIQPAKKSISVNTQKTVSSSRKRRSPVNLILAVNQSNELVQPSTYFGHKYAIERIIAALLLIPALPVIFILTCLVRATSRGPAIYRQKRVGLNGRVFSIFKIRTMNVDAETTSGPKWSTSNDPRVTRLGRLLRLLHLDELPQLANVVAGDMTIIGPRPERPEIVTVLLEQVDQYASRLVVKPGITGLAQIYLPPDETIDCVRKKVCVDRAYIIAASPLVDVQIWLCTIVRILGLRKGRGPRWFGLDRRFLGVVKRCSDIGSETDGLSDESLCSYRNGTANRSAEWVGTGQNGHSRHDPAHAIPNGISASSNGNAHPHVPR